MCGSHGQTQTLNYESLKCGIITPPPWGSHKWRMGWGGGEGRGDLTMLLILSPLQAKAG